MLALGDEIGGRGSCSDCDEEYHRNLRHVPEVQSKEATSVADRIVRSHLDFVKSTRAYSRI